MTDREEARAQRRQALQDQVALAEAAAEVMSNVAAMAYFSSAEAQAIDAMVSVDGVTPDDDRNRLRLAIIVKTTREFRAFLTGARDQGAFAVEMLLGMDREDKTQ